MKRLQDVLFKRCPDCGRKILRARMVIVTDEGPEFEVCPDCFEEIHFERTEIWKRCLKSAR